MISFYHPTYNTAASHYRAMSSPRVTHVAYARARASVSSCVVPRWEQGDFQQSRCTHVGSRGTLARGYACRAARNDAAANQLSAFP